jgi:hypothetical protein
MIFTLMDSSHTHSKYDSKIKVEHTITTIYDLKTNISNYHKGVISIAIIITQFRHCQTFNFDNMNVIDISIKVDRK